jgi:2-amino-4-hydroxy-6-hydroxymethyldihydropteridine diphosphokinase
MDFGTPENFVLRQPAAMLSSCSGCRNIRADREDMTNAFICLGSNMNNPPRQIRAAREALTALPEMRLLATSPVYRTEPQGKKEQPWFHNQVAHLACGPSWSAQALLDALLAIETALGRQRSGKAHYGPRCIDLDLLLFGTERCKNKRLCLPHPRMFERAFVLVPLQDVAPGLAFPDGRSLQGCLTALSYRLQADCIYQ